MLATDMMNHSKLISTMSSKFSKNSKKNDDDAPFCLTKYLEETNSLNNKFDVQQDFINFVLHAIDIGHAAKPFDLEVKWADLVTMEFHNQGDTEKNRGLQVSFLCDRTTSNLPASQKGFIAGIVLPTFQLVVGFLPKMKMYVELIEIAKDGWEKIKESKSQTQVN